MMGRTCLAIDIGASSGRHIVGWMENGELRTEEVYRFPNGVERKDGRLVWDVERLLSEVKEGIARAKESFHVDSLSIDTWGVDYVLMKGDREVLPVYAYRDSRTEEVIPRVHEKIPFGELYARTGCQFQPFNTVYQLAADLEAGRLEGVTDFLMIPEYLMYRLTGVKRKEFTNATTTGMIHAETLSFDREIAERLSLPARLFPELSRPGETVGVYDGIEVVLCATHDTGSAVEGIPMEEGEPYLSSGTWSLLGVRTERPLTDAASMGGNWSNEGGVGYNRYQKNIMGMWLVNGLKKELCPDVPFGEIVKRAEGSAFTEAVDANDPDLLSPASMKEAFDGLLAEKPGDIWGYFSCACRSLALCYGSAVAEMERNTGREYHSLYIVGGGARNGFLNRLTEQATGKRVIALPIEATALGNLRIQLER